jgi:hypothetical protein
LASMTGTQQIHPTDPLCILQPDFSVIFTKDLYDWLTSPVCLAWARGITVPGGQTYPYPLVHSMGCLFCQRHPHFTDSHESIRPLPPPPRHLTWGRMRGPRAWNHMSTSSTAKQVCPCFSRQRTLPVGQSGSGSKRDVHGSCRRDCLVTGLGFPTPGHQPVLSGPGLGNPASGWADDGGSLDGATNMALNEAQADVYLVGEWVVQIRERDTSER